MSKHAPGPLVLDSIEGVKDSGGRRLRLTGVALDGGSDEAKANTRLIAAAYNSYDKHCGPRAVECAEGDLLGELLEACRQSAAFVRHLLEFFSWGLFPHLHQSAEELRDKLEAAVAQTEGGAK